ncbi:MAG: TetR/AcrR family transcriptional regulator [bacterium]
MALSRLTKLDPDKKAKIIRIATEEFAERGYEKASLSRIITRCGMSRGALYYYFADKDDLYATVLDEFSSALLDIWSGDPPQQAPAFAHVDSPEAYWKEWMFSYQRSIRYYVQQPSGSQLLWQAVHTRTSGTSHPAQNALAARMRQWLREALERGQQISAVRADLPEDLLFETVAGVAEGFARWLAQKWSGIDEGQIDELARLAAGFLQRVAEPVPDRIAGLA